MALPKITFNIATDGLGRLSDAINKIPGLVITGSTVANKITIGQSYQIFSLKGAEDLGITADGANSFAYKHLVSFYNKAGQGAPLWLMVVSDATTMTAMADLTNNYAKKLIEDAKNIRVLGLLKKATGTETIKNGLDADVETAVVKIQELAVHFTGKYFPFRTILSGNSFNGNVQELFDYSQSKFKNVNILIANDDGAPEASIGLNLGKQVAIPSQRRQSRVKDGAVIPLQAYFTSGEKVQALQDMWDTIDDKRFTFFRNFSNRSGYFFSGDKTLVGSDDDFSSLAPGFIMDEAVLIAYDVLLDELSDEILIDGYGKIHPAVIKSWQGKIDTTVQSKMVSTGKISGFKSYINANQNVLQTDNVQVNMQLLPLGYADNIEVNIGFTTNLEN
ncbi:DUF2586 family protein [Tenacibaculum salmonis]|uniref:DUF2586 family protein n=1 Tax=Tenacibaculum sp. P3-BQ1 TaxID=3232310 RepID=UPI0034DE64F7